MAGPFVFDNVDPCPSQPLYNYHPYNASPYDEDTSSNWNGGYFFPSTKPQYLSPPPPPPPFEYGKNYIATAILEQTSPKQSYFATTVSALFSESPFDPSSSQSPHSLDNNSPTLVQRSFADRVSFEHRSLSFSLPNTPPQVTNSSSPSSRTSSDIGASTGLMNNSPPTLVQQTSIDQIPFDQKLRSFSPLNNSPQVIDPSSLQVIDPSSPSSDTSSDFAEPKIFRSNSICSTTSTAESTPTPTTSTSLSSKTRTQNHNHRLRTLTNIKASQPRTRLTHNTIEKRYRTNLNQAIDSLWKSLPSTSPSGEATKPKPCKAQIIASARTQILSLRRENERTKRELRDLREKTKAYEELLTGRVGGRLRGKGL